MTKQRYIIHGNALIVILILISRLLKNDFFDIFYAKNPMILRVIFSKHGFFNTLLALEHDGD